MPRSTGGLAFALALALVVADYAVAVADDRDVVAAGDNGSDHADFAVDVAGEVAADVTGQDHVDFSGDEWGEDHVDFAIGAMGEEQGGDRGQTHTDFCVDPAGAYTIEVELLPGENGAEICCAGDRGESHTDFRIAIRADGAVEVNGKQAALCDPNEGCRVSLAWCPGTGAMVVHVADAKGLAFAAQYAMTGAPEEVRIAAAEVRSLSVVPR